MRFVANWVLWFCWSLQIPTAISLGEFQSVIVKNGVVEISIPLKMKNGDYRKQMTNWSELIL